MGHYHQRFSWPRFLVGPPCWVVYPLELVTTTTMTSTLTIQGWLIIAQPFTDDGGQTCCIDIESPCGNYGSNLATAESTGQVEDYMTLLKTKNVPAPVIGAAIRLEKIHSMSSPNKQTETKQMKTHPVKPKIKSKSKIVQRIEDAGYHIEKTGQEWHVWHKDDHSVTAIYDRLKDIPSFPPYV